MKCLVTADIHYALKQFDWLVEVAPDFDHVIIAGDMLEISSMVDRRAQIVVVRAYLERIAQITRLTVCSGNHDLDGESAAGEKMADWLQDVGDLGVAADGTSFEIDDTLFTVCPWWDGPEAQDAIARQLAADAERRPARWIWVYHAPPAESPVSWSGSRHYGDTRLSEWIALYRPDLVLSGHVHQSPFIPGGSWADRIGDTWVFNTGQQLGPAPCHIAFDTEAEEAAWFSLEGNELLSLAAPLERPIAPLASLPGWLRAQNG